MKNDRDVWRPSPDSEEIRPHLLALLENFVEHVLESRYPIGPDVGEVVQQQLGEFREERAEERLRWVNENIQKPWSDVAREALAKIRGRD